jgi:hypothetical protein
LKFGVLDVVNDFGSLMLESEQKKLEKFGFKFSKNGAHTARTIMLSELHELLDYVQCISAEKTEYADAVQVSNCLGKRSDKTRTLTYRHLVDLYTLDSNYILFRALRFFWQRDPQGRQLLAILCAYCRDSLFRSTAFFVLDFSDGQVLSRQALESYIESNNSGRFSPATLKSTAQNINSSWTQAGHLSGRASKVRSHATPTPGSVAFALLLGYLSGLRGEFLFKSEYIKLLDCDFIKAMELAETASYNGWLVLKRVGQVVEVDFQNLINTQEREWLYE